MRGIHEAGRDLTVYCVLVLTVVDVPVGVCDLWHLVLSRRRSRQDPLAVSTVGNLFRRDLAV